MQGYHIIPARLCLAIFFTLTLLCCGQNVPLRMAINELFRRHQPSKHPFWKDLARAPRVIMDDRTPNGFLAHLYLAYQGAMHATRAAVYSVPLHTPEQRLQLAAVIVDDDNFVTGESHHFHLECMFRSKMGIDPVGEFGDLKELVTRMDRELPASGGDVLAPVASHFVRRVEQLYPLSPAAWCIAEVLSDDWLSILAKSLSPHFPGIEKTPYFDEITTGEVEILHMMTAVRHLFSHLPLSPRWQTLLRVCLLAGSLG